MSENEKKPAFEAQLGQLETIVRALDSDEMPLEKAIASYEEGVKLAASLNKTLEEAQKKIEILTQTATGEITAQPFEEGQA